ncbi:hypothetical protein [Rhizobium ruizarguesonis]|uniref:hypothetical protein n=1 Tax=Rhizobium ruizarguesonis TaxID=2081791 RepID=UPI00102FCF94|nr:hypothetical protein [Rhizobium ruizarguesonis]TBD34860.1 hypothetical protein ELH17_33410 [Rhizobium ruizarguesonis]TBD54536.1 hypothetical protein ELH16_31770 [Rhizobium ruizarguesonis]TBF00473.1 hypothetical protein ELG96_34715 [Rhizobium ruizarguesonis]
MTVARDSPILPRACSPIEPVENQAAGRIAEISVAAKPIKQHGWYGCGVAITLSGKDEREADDQRRVILAIAATPAGQRRVSSGRTTQFERRR